MAFTFPQKDSPNKDSTVTLHKGILSAYDGLAIHVQEQSLGGGEKVSGGINSKIHPHAIPRNRTRAVRTRLMLIRRGIKAIMAKKPRTTL
jgi:hypothetical protein